MSPTPIRKPTKPIRRPEKPPVYMTIRKAAKKAGIHHATMKKYCEREGILRKVGDRQLISIPLLLRAFPEIHERVMDEHYEGADDSPYDDR